jgi:LPXTG-site transpeptidase (sortase) family protein
MKKIVILKNSARLFTLLAVFALGVVGGVYYQNEILVYWRSFVISNNSQPTSTSTLEQQPLESKTKHSSTLQMNQLEEPLPLIYSDTLEEEQIQKHLKKGAVVLPLGVALGESGNVVITAHSSGSQAFGPYRFAFSKLGKLEEGNEFNIHTTTATYTYRVYGKEIVWPHEIDKLPNDDRSTVTLVTCWPIWTNFKRLLVHAELINTNYKL